MNNYVITQNNNDIIIFKNDKEVFHTICERKLSNEELEEYIKNYIQIQMKKEFRGE